jgi:hypothetical protein
MSDKKRTLNYVFNESTVEWQPQPYSATVSGGGGGSSLSKTIQSEVQAMTTVSANDVSVTDAVNVSNIQGAAIFIDHAPVGTDAPGVGTIYEIEASEKATGNDTWRTIAIYKSATIAAATVTVSESNYPAQTVIPMNPTPAYTLTDNVFFFNTDDFANSEWGKMADLSANVSIELRDGLTNTQASSVLYNRAEHYVALLDLTALTRLRVTCHNNGHADAEDVIWRVALITGEYV